MITFEDIVQKIASLAPLSDVVLQIEALYAKGNDEVKVTDLIALIESDAMLSIDILKMANAPVYGFSSRIASVSQAVTLFGIMQVRSFVMSHAISQALQTDMGVYGISNETFNDICNLQSALVIQWYSQISLDDVKTIAPLALIMEAGKLVLAQEIHKSNYSEIFLEGLKKCNDILEYERELFDISSYEISALLFKHWNLDPIYIEILDTIHTQEDQHITQYQQMVSCVRHAINPKEILTKSSVISGCRVVSTMGLDVEHFVKACVRVKKIYAEKLQKQKGVES